MNCIFCNKTLSPMGKTHELFCEMNPNGKNRKGSNNPMYGKRGANHYTKGAKMKDETKLKISKSSKGRSMPEDIRKKISESMKIAHEEKRAWNIGQSRWNSKKSWPEMFFSTFLESNDIKYKSEVPVGIYSIDFVISDNLAIEIDGKQHFLDLATTERDIRKNMKLKESGWKLLRVSWNRLFNDSINCLSEVLHWIDHPTEYKELY